MAGAAKMPMATPRTNSRRSITESPRQRMEVQPRDQRGVADFGNHPVLADKHRWTSAMERNGLRPVVAASRIPASGNSRSGRMCSFAKTGRLTLVFSWRGSAVRSNRLLACRGGLR